MTIPGPDEALSPRLPEDEQAAAITTPRGCPFLLADGGGWRLDVPARDHECTAVSPAAALSLEKQARLCLTAAYVSCATYLASVEARGSRLGAPELDDATRWRLTRTTAVIEDAGGVRSRLAAALTDRGRWPAVPAVLLLTGLIVLGLSGLRGTPASAIASPTPPSSAAGATASPRTTPRPSSLPGTTEPSVAPTTAPTFSPPPTAPTATTGPQETFRLYAVKSGDSLSLIASKFGTTSKAIADLNGIKTSTTLHIGQVLKIPNT